MRCGLGRQAGQVRPACRRALRRQTRLILYSLASVSARWRVKQASLVFACSPDSPLLRREGRSLRPPSARENFLSASDYWREGRFRAQTRLGSHGVLTSRQERFAMQLRERLPDSGSGLIIGDFVSKKIPGHEGLGAGKSTTRGGREEHAYFLKE